MKLFMKYQWLLYVIGWFIFQLFPAYFRLTSVADEFIPFLFIVGIIVIAICSFNGAAKGRVAGWLMFVLSVIVEVFVALTTFFLLLGQSWQN